MGCKDYYAVSPIINYGKHGYWHSVRDKEKIQKNYITGYFGIL